MNISIYRIKTGDGPPEWYKYFLCGVRGVLDELMPTEEGESQLRGMSVMVSGNIPPASGLSSSSALVSAAVLATAHANALMLDRQQLASVSARCERHIGTCGGGMDQAIAFLAEKGKAQFIEWSPLRATPVQLPSEAVFVIANSLTEANKAATSDFNQRVVECHLGCRLMAKRLLKSTAWRDYVKYSTLQQELECTLEGMESLARKCLKQEVYSRSDMIEEFELDDDHQLTELLTPNTKSSEEFRLLPRALHVFQEASRVDAFRKAAELGDLTQMCLLMRQSHSSLASQYQCSHANLDKLTTIAGQVGKVGARLTGAGWGGCIVVLCNSIEQCHTLTEQLKVNYYDKLSNGPPSLDNTVFITDPQAGAVIITNNNA